MLNRFLYRLYFLAPKKIGNAILKYITKKEGGQMYSHTLRAIYNQLWEIKIGYGSYGGCFSVKNIPPGVTFGNYCSIAPEIRIFRANHPKDSFTSHPLLYNPSAGYVNSDQLIRPKLNVGHDVWIGEWAIILPRVKQIGNGAMIGAGAVVTKDVPPYTIVAGNPAKVIGKRFNDETIARLEATRWWDMDKKTLMENISKIERQING
ncbi:CatB-related O-acetyltransferase [Dyadobacter sp. CY323]|uniref:CatB-related O-acetyltransferase n=1 Tax=Dyadobacter sp. CY323 TaxID=2907302 RepID=UPI001F396FDC|nr:CatB-related O-acetyltransferase [Dyadobacter sp. CY323]MCE6992758.1 CatB-related O-acetyltransferase [Dyadobacter sp. CY323]